MRPCVACRSLNLAGERLAALGTRQWRRDSGQQARMVLGITVLQGCTMLTKPCVMPPAEAQRFCSHCLELLLGAGTELLQCLPAQLGLHQPQPARALQVEPAGAPAFSAAPHAAFSLGALVRGQAVGVHNILHFAAQSGWSGNPAAAGDWCPPAKLAAWLAAAVQLLRLQGPQRGDSGMQSP